MSPLNTGITDADLQTTYHVFPNPTAGKINIVVNSVSSENYTLDIYNAIGQIIYSEHIPQLSKEMKKEIHVGAFGKGLYIIKLTSSSHSKSTKIIVE